MVVGVWLLVFGLCVADGLVVGLDVGRWCLVVGVRFVVLLVIWALVCMFVLVVGGSVLVFGCRLLAVVFVCDSIEMYDCPLS